jgi:two-component system, LytTR family, response regulator
VNTIKALIVDDEPLARKGVRQLLADHTDVAIVGEAATGNEAIRMIKKLGPDLVFLDVQMPEIDGFAVLKNLEARDKFAVIFVTAHDEYAIRAFEEHALDYLLKPLNEGRFTDALNRTRIALTSKQAMDSSIRLKRLLDEQGGSIASVNDSSRSQRLLINNGRGDFLLQPFEIDWIEADDYYSVIHALGRRHLVRESLESLHLRLDRSQFVRIHRKTIVNLAQIREVRSQGNDAATVILCSGAALPLSRRRKATVSKAIRSFSHRLILDAGNRS